MTTNYDEKGDHHTSLKRATLKVAHHDMTTNYDEKGDRKGRPHYKFLYLYLNATEALCFINDTPCHHMTHSATTAGPSA